MNSVLNKEIENTDTYLNHLGCKKSAQKVVYIEGRAHVQGHYLYKHKDIVNV